MAAWRFLTTSTLCAAGAACSPPRPNGPAWTTPPLPARPGGSRTCCAHVGYIHRWTARHIIECPEAVLDGPSEAEILRTGATDDELLSWFRVGHARLIETLAEADPALV